MAQSMMAHSMLNTLTLSNINRFSKFLRCGGIFSDNVITHLLLILTVTSTNVGSTNQSANRTFPSGITYAYPYGKNAIISCVISDISCA